MNIFLGNLTIEEIQHRAGVTFPDALIDYMKDRHQDKAENIESGKWHCFDMPFSLACGDMETATVIHNHLKPLSSQFKEPLSISLQK